LVLIFEIAIAIAIDFGRCLRPGYPLYLFIFKEKIKRMPLLSLTRLWELEI
jgi:hypothetical protein